MLNKKSSYLSLILALLCVTFFASQLTKIEFDYDLEGFFTKNDPDFKYYQKISKRFGQDNDNILINLGSNTSLFDSVFLSAVYRAEKEILSIKGTKSTISPLSLKKPVKTPMGYIEIPYVHRNDSRELKKDSLRVLKDEKFRNAFFSKDFRNLKIVLVHETFSSKEAADKYVADINEILAQYPLENVRTSGKIIAQSAFIKALEADFSKFLGFALALVIVMLVIFVRNPILVIASLLITLLALVSTLGLMVVTGKRIDVLSTLIPSIILVVSMSDIIHLFSQARNELSKTNDPLEAVNLAVKKIGWATFLTSLTTAIGFLTLTTFEVRPVVDLGIYSALGIALAFLLTYLVFPQILIFMKPKTLHIGRKKRIIALMESLFLLITRNGRRIIFISIALAGIMFYGIDLLKVESYLVDDLPKNNMVREDFEFFNSNYVGARPFTMAVWPKDSSKSIYTKEHLTELEQIQSYAEGIMQAGDIISPISITKTVHQSLHNGNPEFYTLPKDHRYWKATLREINRKKLFEQANITSGNISLISGFVFDEGSIDSKNKRRTFEAAVRREVNPQLVDYRITGTSLLVEKSHETLSFNLIKGLLIALLIVGIMAAIMFKSYKMFWITLVPNLFPIMAVAAIMGYLGIPINLGSSVMFAISFGIAVDDTIHFLSKFLIEKKQQRSNLYAVRRTLITSGEPILITTIILASGFLVFSFSAFNASFYIGLFVSVSFVVALVADLTLLPVLLLRFFPEKDSSN